MMNAATFGLMRPGAWFINTARESLVDEAALLNCLQTGHLAAAALDVLNATPPGTRSPLLDLGNVLVTPHIGGAAFETLRRGAEMVAAEVERFAAGEPLRYPVSNAGSNPAGATAAPR